MFSKILLSIFLFLILITLSRPLAAADNISLEKKTYESVEERRVYLALQLERESLTKERSLLEEKKLELKRLETEVDKKLKQLTQTRNEIKNLLTEKDEKEAERIKELSKIYEKMDSESVAKILMNLEQKLAVAILKRMKVKSASAALNKMDRKKAASLTAAFSKLDP
ncbi:MAG: hypothetical protein OEM02_00470 [Desulfobulbaceae bacterium]|nr:hypothetical protein [Desulfobulbaceae bacterium]